MMSAVDFLVRLFAIYGVIQASRFSWKFLFLAQEWYSKGHRKHAYHCAFACFTGVLALSLSLQTWIWLISK